jgi:hypothetical protein
MYIYRIPLLFCALLPWHCCLQTLKKCAHVAPHAIYVGSRNFGGVTDTTANDPPPFLGHFLFLACKKSFLKIVSNRCCNSQKILFEKRNRRVCVFVPRNPRNSQGRRRREQRVVKRGFVFSPAKEFFTVYQSLACPSSTATHASPQERDGSTMAQCAPHWPLLLPFASIVVVGVGVVVVVGVVVAASASSLSRGADDSTRAAASSSLVCRFCR